MKSSEEAERALRAATEAQVSTRLGLLNLAGFCVESSSLEHTSDSASWKQSGLLQQDLLEDNDEQIDNMMQNHLRAIIEQTDRDKDSDKQPESPASGSKGRLRIKNNDRTNERSTPTENRSVKTSSNANSAADNDKE